MNADTVSGATRSQPQPDSPPRLRAEPRSSRRFPLAYVSAGVAALFSVPLLGVVLNVFREGQGNWPHLVSSRM